MTCCEKKPADLDIIDRLAPMVDLASLATDLARDGEAAQAAIAASALHRDLVRLVADLEAASKPNGTR